MDADEYMDTMEDLAWEEAQESEDLSAQDLIDRQVERPRDRLRLIFIVGNYLNLSRAAYKNEDEARLERTAKALGVTTTDLIEWYLND